MASATLAKVVVRPLVPPPRVALKFRLLRDGGVSSGPKTLLVYRDWGTITKLEMAFHADDGEWTRTQDFDLATLLAQGEWLVTGLDPQPPRKTRAVFMTFAESATLTYNITLGDGGGGVEGDAATIAASVRVDQQPAAREVVVLEKPSDGQWRIAGYGIAATGTSDVELKVTGGLCYAIAIDDYGVAFQPNLAVAVGQTIRPSLFAGWLYRITESGSLPEAEPQWWPIEGENPPRLLGSARAQAVRYYRPLAHGPVAVKVT